MPAQREFVPNPHLEGRLIEIRRVGGHSVPEDEKIAKTYRNVPAGHELYCSISDDGMWVESGIRPKAAAEPKKPSGADNLDGKTDKQLQRLCGENGVAYDPAKFIRGDALVALRAKLAEKAGGA